MVVEPHEIGAVDLLEKPDVMEAQCARPDHTDAHRPRMPRHTITPRCDASMKRRNVSTSGTSGSSTRARATPWLTVRSELNTRRQVRFSASFTSAGKSARCTPTELRPYRWTGLPAAF